MSELTPMMKQYFEIKHRHEDCILFYRLGDFYEMFYDDAITASRVLDIALTGRAAGNDTKAPMCGVPYHSCEGYIAKLIANGYKVAICEQTEDPATAKGLVSRDIVRIITPGTVTESSMLSESANNYIFSAYAEDKRVGIAFADITTGEILATSFVQDAAICESLINECERFSPREGVLPPCIFEFTPFYHHLRDRMSIPVEQPGDESFSLAEAQANIVSQFSAAALSDASEYGTALIRAVGGLLNYLHETQKNELSHLNRLELYTQGLYMSLDHNARRNLELFETLRSHEKKGSLVWVLDKTGTAMGARKLRQWMEKPLLSPAAIGRRLNAVNALVSDAMIRDSLAVELDSIFDLERLIGRIAMGSANARDLNAIAASAQHLPEIRRLTHCCDTELMHTLCDEIDELSDLYSLITQAITDDPPVSVRDGGLIREGFNAEVDTLRSAMKNGKSIVAALEAREKEKTGIKNLKVSFNKVFGYYIEVSKGNIPLVPDTYIRKQTLVNCERYITEELKTIENTILGAQERITGLEYEIFSQIRDRIASQMTRVQKTAQAIAALDVLCSFAKVAVSNDYVMPTVDYDTVIDIADGRHPVVEKMQGIGSFVPNDTLLDCGDSRVAIITGPNMAGKSTYMRQVAIITLMAQIGSFVPAKSARIGAVDRIFTRIGASDDLASGQSTFMVEMSEVSDIVKNATAKSLLILDEIGRGTSTYDGMSIARAVLEYAAKAIGAKTMFATHYHELTALADEMQGVKNFSTAVKKRGDDITFLRRILPGGADDSYGIEVAKLAGVPDKIISRAKDILASLEDGKTLRPLGRAKKSVQAESQTSLADMGANDLVSRIRDLDLDNLSPMGALNLLYELKILAQRLP